LEEVNAANTKVTNFTFANGAPLHTIKYPSTVQNLVYLNCKDLTYDNIEFAGTDNINTIYISNTPGVAAISLTKDIIESQSKLASRALRYVSLNGIDENFVGAESVKVLELLNDLTDPSKSYYGIDSNGVGSESLKPTITGKIGVEFSYEDTEASLEAFFPGLDITVNTYYVRFADSRVESKLKNLMVALELMTKNETISTENAKLLSSFISGGVSIFKNDALVKSFDELKYFTNITTINGSWDFQSNTANGDFYRCENLESINLENITDIGSYAFNESGITMLYAPKLRTMNESAFRDCKKLIAVQSLGNLETLPNNAFQGCTSLTTVRIPNSCTALNTSVFQGCNSLKTIYIPEKVNRIGSNTFQGCTALEAVYWNFTGQAAPTPPDGGFGAAKTLFIPASMYESISAMSTWAGYMNMIQIYDFEKDVNQAVPKN
jgi:hypothetical protein